MIKKLFLILENFRYHKAAALIVGITGIIVAIIFGIDSHLKNNLTLNQKNYETPVSSTTVQSEIKGDKKIETPSVKQHIYFGSILDLSEKIYLEKITIEKEKIISEIKGLVAEDTGQIVDITKQKYDSYEREKFDIPEGEYFAITIGKSNKYNRNTLINAPTIQCDFLDNWQGALASVKYFDEIKFKGEIYAGKNYNSIWAKQNTPLIFLKNCELIKQSDL